jgi:amino acid adenylation domain-containing protein
MSDSPKPDGLLSAEKSGLFALLLKQKRIKPEQVGSITRAETLGPCLLSFAQQRLWFLDQLEPGTHLYNIPVVLRFNGPLNVVALKQSLAEVTRRHVVLRATFVAVEGIPMQSFAEEVNVPLPIYDLSRLPQSERETEARRLTEEEFQRAFDLARGPVFRAALLRLRDDEHVLLLTMHHIVSDGWSIEILKRELGQLYKAYAGGRLSPLEELPVQYSDYARWQREWLQGEALEEQLEYWRSQLAGAPQVLELPTDRPRPATQTFHGASESFVVPAALTVALGALSRREGATLFMTLLAGFAAVLSRYSGQEEVVVGTPIAGRTRREVEGLIGFFVNTLPLRADLTGNPSFGELLGRVREACLGGYQHQELPFEKLVEELQPERSLSRNPLFQVMFVFHNASGQGSRPFRGESLDEEGGEATAKFDLTLVMHERSGEELSGTIEYNTDLYEAETITRMVGHLQTLLAAAVATPERAVSELQLLTEAERRRIVTEWNDTASATPAYLSVQELFARQAAATPEAVAVVGANERLTYRELNESANRLAHYLGGLGVGAEQLVGVMSERTPRLLVALLGVLKAGGAYVPLDATYPVSRLSFVLADAGVSVLLTAGPGVADLPLDGLRVVELQTQWEEIERCPATDPGVVTAAEQLAYVIYTSGSTGRPKGVAIEHGSVSSFLHWAHESFSRAELAGVLGSTSICFDLSVFELFAPLTCGGAVVLAENALELPSHPAVNQVTLVNTVPSAMRELASARALPASVTTVNLAGEPLARSLVAAVYEQETVERVLNLYGPSEDTTYSTYVVLERGGQQPPSIGRPLANKQVYLLDKWFQVVPVGVVGELYIGGAGLARGYVKRPGLTAEKFVPDPFSPEPGRRLYRTGDLARYAADGELEFLGRRDHQVKVRGYRIELGEVETALQRHAAVREAVVVAREEAAGERRLVAYLVGADASERLSISQLRAYLLEQLPEYMVPAAFVVLEQLPLTPNGKVDRQALPAPDAGAMPAAAGYVAPRTAAELVLAEIWAEVLGLERVGVEDNFFELGGHSLLATRIISRLREAFQCELPLRTMFEEPTVARLVAQAARRVGGTEVLEEIAQTFNQLKHLSEDEVNALLAEQTL